MNTRATILLLSLGAFGYGCEQSASPTDSGVSGARGPTTEGKSASPSEKAATPYPDARKDGAAYRQRRARNVEGWAYSRELPDCIGKQLTPADVALCTRAAEMRAALRQAEEEQATDDAILEAASQYAAAAEAARARFQGYAMVWVMGKDPRQVETVEVVAPKTGVRADAKTAADEKHTKDDGHEHSPAELALKSTGTPYSDLLNGYASATTEGLRRLTTALRFAPPSVRDAALARYDAFLDQHPKSAIALRQLKEAEFLEADRAFRSKISEVRSKKRAKTKTDPGASPAPKPTTPATMPPPTSPAPAE